jgi:hypothetical protein
MFEWYEELPEWLRWVLFIPLSVAGTFIGAVIYLFIREDEFAFVKPGFVMLITLFVVFAFAPRAKKQLALASLIFRVIVVTIMMSLVYMVEGYFEVQTLWEIGYELLGYIITFFVWWKFLHKNA